MNNDGVVLFGGLVGVGAIVALIILAMWGIPKYKVYAKSLAGKAVLVEAEYSRRVEVEEATAKLDASEKLAEAEVIRARGAARANEIVADGLGGPEGYLRYLAIEVIREQAGNGQATFIYLPTEAGVPITEASRFNKPLALD